MLALKVYKEAAQSGNASRRMLDKVLGCLREPLPAVSPAGEDDSWRSSPRRLPAARPSTPRAAFPLDSEAPSEIGSSWQMMVMHIAHCTLRHAIHCPM